MDTPICDFVRRYADSSLLRLHMPGHKGIGPLGCEQLDITEIDGADSLYEADGIIRRSEENASSLFGCPTYYSAEGSSLCIRAMLYLCMQYARQLGRKPVIAAGRNAHKTLLTAAAVLDFDLAWLYPGDSGNYLSCSIDAQSLSHQLQQMEQKPVAVYLTTPDYLGNETDIAAMAKVCHDFGCLLLVDNAHGAYLRFLPRSRHPMDLGADLCCDSAHKTLPVLTGGAYLHISASAPALFQENAKDALAMFGSTSPSYLILQSLDAANRYLAEGYPEKLADFASRVEALKAELTDHGYRLAGSEALKLTLLTKAYGYTGKELSSILLGKGIVCEFADPDHLVLMLTPEVGIDGLAMLKEALLSVPQKAAIDIQPPKYSPAQKALSVRDAALRCSETVPAGKSLGRIYAGTSIGCPPAVPIIVCGERIDEAAIERLAYYGIDSCPVVTE